MAESMSQQGMPINFHFNKISTISVIMASVGPYEDFAVIIETMEVEGFMDVVTSCAMTSILLWELQAKWKFVYTRR